MQVITRLFNIIDNRIGATKRKRFQSLLDKAEYSDMLNVEALHLKKPLIYENDTNTTQSFTVSCHLDKYRDSLESLFKIFTISVNHANPFGHFRNYPELYSRVLSCPRYFAFHGDGNCFAVSMIFQGFIKKTLGKAIEVRYGTVPNKGYMHTYCLDSEYYVDPDQKTYCLYSDIMKSGPKGFIFSLLSFAGFEIFENVSIDLRHQLFPSMTFDFFKDFSVDKQPEIYKDNVSIIRLRKKFNEMLLKYSEVVYMEDERFEWKRNFINSILSQGDLSSWFFSKLDKPYYCPLPPKAKITIGYNYEKLPAEIFDFSSIYFGRIPGVLEIFIPANQEVVVNSPEFPWMLAFDDYYETIQLDDRQIQLSKSNCLRYGYIGMGSLERVTNYSKNEFSYRILSKKDVSLKVIFPVNVYALNAGFIDFRLTSK